MLFDSLQLFTIEQAELYQHYYQQSGTELADACLNSRIAWIPGYLYRYVELEDCICLVTDGGVLALPHFYLPIGDLNQLKLQRIVDYMATLFAQKKWDLRCLFVDEKYVPMFQALTGYEVDASYNRDFSDYLYDAESLRTLKGRKFRSKRNHINHFIREYPGFTYHRLTAEDRDKALHLVKTWCQEKDVDCCDLAQSDYIPIRNLFDHMDQLEIHGGAAYFEQELIAFSMGSVLCDNLAFIHFEKAHPDYEGIYSVINQWTMQREFPDVEWVNREEDMGLEGMRTAKESYLPARLLHKYQIELRAGKEMKHDE